MRILWFTNVELNCIAEQLGRTIVVGGWDEYNGDTA